MNNKIDSLLFWVTLYSLFRSADEASKRVHNEAMETNNPGPPTVGGSPEAKISSAGLQIVVTGPQSTAHAGLIFSPLSLD